MAAGVFQPIRPWDVEAFRSGLLPAAYVQESASLNTKAGTPHTLNSARQLAACAASFLQAAFISADDSANASSAGSLIQAWRITPDFIFEVTLNEAWALNLIGNSYGLVKDATTGYWYLSTADTGNQMSIIGAPGSTAVGDTKSRVLATFNRPAIQWIAGVNGLQPGMGAALTSATTITPTNRTHHVSGTTTINTITAPAGILTGDELTLIADGANLTVSVAGNVNDRLDLLAGQSVKLVYDTTTTKWYAEQPVVLAPAVISADGAVAVRPGSYIITKAGVAALTLAAPVDVTDDGIVITISSHTANAHTLTATGLFECGTASVNLATFAAQKGAGLTLMAYNAKWVVKSSVQITFS